MPGGQFCHLLPLGIQALPLGRVKGLLGGQDFRASSCWAAYWDVLAYWSVDS